MKKLKVENLINTKAIKEEVERENKGSEIVEGRKKGRERDGRKWNVDMNCERKKVGKIY